MYGKTSAVARGGLVAVSVVESKGSFWLFGCKETVAREVLI